MPYDLQAREEVFLLEGRYKQVLQYHLLSLD